MEHKISGLNVKGISVVIPQNRLFMSDFYGKYGENEIKRIVMSTGIESVHIANKVTTTLNLCEKAALNLFEDLGIGVDSIDGIIFVSQTPDYKMPATSCILQHRLGLKKEVVAFDINYGCSGYIYGLYQASMLLSAGGCNRVLLCAGDTISRNLNPDDYKVRLIFGDAGSATIIDKGETEWAFDIRTDGAGYNELIILKDEAGNDDYLHMNGGAIMAFALREIKPIFDNILLIKGWTSKDISQVVFHQANQFILNYLRKKLGLDSSIVPVSIKQYGNTGPASIPLTLCDQYSEVGKTLGKSVLIGFGVGLSWGACALDLTGCRLLSVAEL
ncbi:MAG: ketoacyl-ACP synthase III [Gammaproteobacteria bacterium]